MDGIKILLVDDAEHIRWLYTEALQEEFDAEVLTLSSGYKLLEIIEQEKPDVLIMDIRLGWEDGIRLLQDVRNRFHSLPIILVSAYDTFKEDMKSIAADFCVIKSFDLSELIDKITLVLKYRVENLRPLKRVGLDTIDQEIIRFFSFSSDVKMPISINDFAVRDFFDRLEVAGFLEFYGKEEIESRFLDLAGRYSHEMQIAAAIIRGNISKDTVLAETDLEGLYRRNQWTVLSEWAFIREVTKYCSEILKVL